MDCTALRQGESAFDVSDEGVGGDPRAPCHARCRTSQSCTSIQAWAFLISPASPGTVIPSR
ncbi:unnamed protein product [Eretmochelys imbricata]